MKRSALLLACAGLAACASQPEELASHYVSPVQYQHYDCEQVTGEMERVSRRVNELYVRLKKTADDDAAQMGVGLVLLWPTLFFLEGGDGPEAAEYSRLRGEYEALEKVAVEKHCDISETTRIARWPAQAMKVAKESCKNPALPELIASTAEQEDFRVTCAGEPAVLVRCETGNCREMK